MENSKIEWTSIYKEDGTVVPGYTFNPWIGCSKVSPGCKNCYAEADMDKRRGRVQWGINGTRSVTSYSYWRQALKWNREAEQSGERRRVFCASLADVFEDWKGQVTDSKGKPLFWSDDYAYSLCDVESIPTFAHQTEKKDKTFYALTLDTIRGYLFWLIESTPQLDWLLLTKRPENIMRVVPEHWQQQFPSNVWIGTSTENQEEADNRIPYLLKVPANIRFLSCEPLLSSIGLLPYFNPCYGEFNENRNIWDLSDFYSLIHWVIAGGESGLKARPVNPQWLRDIKDQCKAANVPFLFKQWGEYVSVSEVAGEGEHYKFPDGRTVRKVGKKLAGRTLDGIEYNEYPIQYLQ